MDEDHWPGPTSSRPNICPSLKTIFSSPQRATGLSSLSKRALIGKLGRFLWWKLKPEVKNLVTQPLLSQSKLFGNIDAYELCWGSLQIDIPMIIPSGCSSNYFECRRCLWSANFVGEDPPTILREQLQSSLSWCNSHDPKYVHLCNLSVFTNEAISDNEGVSM
jgi:hypothetical protein